MWATCCDTWLRGWYVALCRYNETYWFGFMKQNRVDFRVDTGKFDRQARVPPLKGTLNRGKGSSLFNNELY